MPVEAAFDDSVIAVTVWQPQPTDASSNPRQADLQSQVTYLSLSHFLYSA